MATDLAIEDHKTSLEFAKNSSKNVLMVSLSSFVIYHSRILSIVSERRMTQEELLKIIAEHKELNNSLAVGEPV